MTEPTAGRKARLIRRRRFQFSLATLFALTTVAAFAAHWVATRHRVAEAQHTFLAAESSWEIGTARFEQVHEASLHLLEVELAVPLADRRASKIACLNRTAHHERQVNFMLETALWDSKDALERYRGWASQLRAEREKLEMELGVKAEPSP